MPSSRIFQGRFRIVSLISVVLIVAAAAFWIREQMRPVAQSLRLADGTETFFMSDSVLSPAEGFPAPRRVGLDGEFFIRAPQAAEPLILNTKLLVLTVSGASALRIVAYARDEGEQVEVLYGNVEARKSYESPYDEPDQLGAGEMVLINRTIDLMEKETCDVRELRQWSEGLVAAAKTPATPDPR